MALQQWLLAGLFCVATLSAAAAEQKVLVQINQPAQIGAVLDVSTAISILYTSEPCGLPVEHPDNMRRFDSGATPGQPAGCWGRFVNGQVVTLSAEGLETSYSKDQFAEAVLSADRKTLTIKKLGVDPVAANAKAPVSGKGEKVLIMPNSPLEVGDVLQSNDVLMILYTSRKCEMSVSNARDMRRYDFTGRQAKFSGCWGQSINGRIVTIADNGTRENYNELSFDLASYSSQNETFTILKANNRRR